MHLAMHFMQKRSIKQHPALRFIQGDAYSAHINQAYLHNKPFV